MSQIEKSNTGSGIQFVRRSNDYIKLKSQGE